MGDCSFELVVEGPEGGEDEGGVKETSEPKLVEREEVGVREGMELGEPPSISAEEQDIIDLEGVYLVSQSGRNIPCLFSFLKRSPLGIFFGIAHRGHGDQGRQRVTCLSSEAELG